MPECAAGRRSSEREDAVIRPQPARWFEILAARDDATRVLEALARTSAVELEARTAAGLPSTLTDVEPLLQEYAELALRYRPYWPSSDLKSSAFPEPPAATLARDVARVRAWAQEAEPLIEELQACEAERRELAIWRNVLNPLADSPVDLSQLVRSGQVVQARLFVFAPDAPPEVPPGTLVRRAELGGSLYALAVGTAADLQLLAQHAAATKGRAFEIPPWLRASATDTEAHIAERLAALDARERELGAALEALHARHDLHTALGDATRLQWVLENVRALEAGDLFCWITGWTSDRAGTLLAAELERSGARALLHFPPAPHGTKAPLLLANPWWAKPFEIFSRALGMPSGNEADPSVLLAIAVPLMFGYMFGDIGQGIVIAIAGYALRKRFPVARLFVAGGIAAVVFGALFGSAFSLHRLPALWVQPLDDPLAILVVPLIGGAALLTIGLLLNAMEAWWRGEFATWAATDAGFVAAYLGVLTGFLDRTGFVVAAVGATVFCAGHAWHARRAAAALAAIAELVERLLQLLINTLSFARVGAFALAHAGLSSAIVALMDSADSIVVKGLVLVVGNVVVLVLEVMVVSIQTTRLVLFEFFTRFLTAEGRVFRPLPAPPSTLQES
jgi:V/A-type H+-transporting ATPase subunit I